jgi:hypothetical protein
MPKSRKIRSMDAFGLPWAGATIKGDTLTLANGEKYTVSELEHLRWERNSYAHLVRLMRQDTERLKTENATFFNSDELREIQKVVNLLLIILTPKTRQEQKKW